MKLWALKLLAIFFPWIILLIKAKPLQALIAITLQITVIGWAPAVIMAFKSLKQGTV